MSARGDALKSLFPRNNFSVAHDVTDLQRRQRPVTTMASMIYTEQASRMAIVMLQNYLDNN